MVAAEKGGFSIYVPERLTPPTRPAHRQANASTVCRVMENAGAGGVDKVGHDRRAHLDRSRPPIQILYPPYRLHLYAVRHGPRTVRDDAKLVEGGTEPRFVGTVQVQSWAGSTNSYPLTNLAYSIVLNPM
jgi:hypothetical protein